MKYRDARELIQTGDLLGFKRKSGLTATLTRFFTRSDYTHTGIALWIEDGLWLAEINLGHSNHLIPVSQVTDVDFDVFCSPVTDSPRIRSSIVDSLRVRLDYSLRSAVTIGLINWLKLKFRPKVRNALDCSEYNLKIYISAGWDRELRMLSPKELVAMLTFKFSVTASET